LNGYRIHKGWFCSGAKNFISAAPVITKHAFRHLRAT